MDVIRNVLVQSVERMRQEKQIIQPISNDDSVLECAEVAKSRDASDDNGVFYIDTSRQKTPQTSDALITRNQIPTLGEIKRSVSLFAPREHEESVVETDLALRYEAMLLNCLNKGGEIRDAKSVSYVDSGKVLITDFISNTVTLFDASGQPVKRFTANETSEPWGAAMFANGDVAVTSRRQGCVCIWSQDGSEVLAKGELKSPCGLFVDKNGRILVADEVLNDVFVFHRSGRYFLKLSEVSGSSFNQPRYVCCSASGRIVVSDSGNHCVKVFDKDGHFLFEFGSFGRKDGQFRFPYGVCSDGDDNIIVCDHYNNRVAMFSDRGEFMQNLLTERNTLCNPYSVCITSDRDMYVTHGDMRASSVVKYGLKNPENSHTEMPFLDGGDLV